MMTDPIADMLTRIRNAVKVERPVVQMPLSKVKRGLAEVLKREGWLVSNRKSRNKMKRKGEKEKRRRRFVVNRNALQIHLG